MGTDLFGDKQGNNGKTAQQDKLHVDEIMSDGELKLKETDEIPGRMAQVKRVLEEQVGLGRSFDLILREMVFGGKRAGLFYCNGFAKDTVLTEVVQRLTYVTEQDVAAHTLQSFLEKFIPHIQVTRTSSMSEAVDQALIGATALFIEQERQALIIDAKNFPVRSIEEPDLERVVRGARDGFVETLLTNVTLLRRRVRDPRLKLQLTQVGKRTKTHVCIAYIHDIVDIQLVKDIARKIESVDIDGIPLADKQLEEIILNKRWNPYPMVRYSERPDVAAAHILEGHVVVFVDTSPSAMILPTTMFHHLQHAEEYRQTPFIGSYLRWVRYSGIFASLFLLPLWFLLVTNPELKPAGLEFLGPNDQANIPLLIQFLLVEIGIDLMRMAAVHTPTPLATAMGLVAAVLIGDIAVQTGLFVNEVILYMAVAAIGIFATPSYELGLANRITRLALLVAVAIFQIPGLVIGTTVWFIWLAAQRSFNAPYLWPFLPFDAKGMWELITRQPVQNMRKRLSLTKSYDSTRQPT